MGHTIEILSWIGCVLTSSILIPQGYKIIKTKETKALSLYMYIIYALSAIVWIIYAILDEKYAIIATNTIVLILAAIILTLKINNIIKKKEKP